MTRRAGLALMLLMASTAWAQPSRTPLARGTIVITGVNVIPMTKDTMLYDQIVVVRDGRIATIGPTATTRPPEAARRINGTGKYLIPGLADAHTHLYSDEQVADSLARYELGVMLANGVTTARLMIGTPEQLTLRADVIAGRIIGPQLWLASPQLTGRAASNARVVTTPEQARTAVREVVAAGFDFIKITKALLPEVYEAVMAESKAQGIRVDGHVDPRVGVQRALDLGQNIQHLDGYIEAALADSAPPGPSLTQGGVFRLANWKSIDFASNDRIAKLGGATARAGVWSTPTLVVFNKAFAIGFTDEELRGRADWSLMPSEVRRLYMGARTRYWNAANDSVRTPARRQRYVEVRNRLAKAIADSGGRLLAGSDSPDWFMGYGWTLHREMEALVNAGLTPYQALSAATRNPAQYFNAEREWGTIETGKRADLVLLSANPLERIQNSTRIEGIAVGGRWMTRAELDGMVRAAVERINGQ